MTQKWTWDSMVSKNGVNYFGKRSLQDHRRLKDYF